MAGLLDIFGSGGGDTLGLLGMSPENIQQARDDAQAQALYGLAARLFQGGNTGQSIAEGLQQGQKLYKSALQNQMQEQLQGFQVQDMLRKRKLEEQALARQAMIDRAVAGAYQPAVQAQPAMFYGQETQLPIRDEEGNLMPFATEPVQGRAAGLDFQSFAPALMASPEGRKTLGELAAAQKAMAGDTFSLAEGAKQFQRNPFTGEVIEVASGAPKREPIQFQDLGNVVIGVQNGKEVMRLPKGRAPEGPVALQHIETDQGIVAFNPRTGTVSPLSQDGKPIMGKDAGKLTEAQGNAVAYGTRMLDANKILTPLEDQGLKDTGKIRAGVSGTLGAVPLIGDALSKGSDNIFNTLPTILGGLSEDQQKVIQARTNFITAVLRKESGASISPSEFATAEKVYFAAPGDSQEVVKQKQKARETVINSMKYQAGPGAKFIGQGVTPTPTSSGW
jgi:hypothetical protein